jgi:hypothetical protein
MVVQQLQTQSFADVKFNLKLNSQGLLINSHNFTSINSNVIYTKDGTTPTLFTDIDDLRSRFPSNLFFDNNLGPINSIPLVQFQLFEYYC